MLENTTENRQQALGLLREGRLDAAAAVYEALLEASPDDPDLTGLMAVVRLQQGALDEAEALFRQALSAEAPARIRLRDLHNLALLLRARGRGAEAGRLALDYPLDWPEGSAADPDERDALRWLVAALVHHNRFGEARELMDRALPDRRGDAEMLYLDGRLKIAEGDPAAAADTLRRAARLAPSDPDPAITCCHALGEAGRAEDAAALATHIARTWPVHADPASKFHTATILVLNPIPARVPKPGTTLRGFHHTINFPKELADSARDRYRFVSVFANLSAADLPVHELRRRLPPCDIVLNNIVNGDVLIASGILARLRERIDALGLPVINHPDGAARTSRPETAVRLAGIDGLKVPRIEAYARDAADESRIIADIEAKFPYPLILRRPIAHASGNKALAGKDPVARLVMDRAELSAGIAAPGWAAFYAIEFVDLRRPDGLYRKMRAGFVGNELAITVPAMQDTWLVTPGRNNPKGVAFLERNPAVVEECRRIAEDPEGALGAKTFEVLHQIRERMPLDVFGIDFDVDAEGRVVIFEAGAAMILLRNSMLDPPEIKLPEAPFERLKAAFHDLVQRHISGVP